MSEQQESLNSELAPLGKYMPGYPAAPGSGPDGKRCRDCRYLIRHERWIRTSFKCGACWNGAHSSTTDIRKNEHSCYLFEQRTALQTIELPRGFKEPSLVMSFEPSLTRRVVEFPVTEVNQGEIRCVVSSPTRKDTITYLLMVDARQLESFNRIESIKGRA